MVFDLLALEGESMIQLPWSERRRLLEELDLNGQRWFTPGWFDDGEALFAVVVDQGLEGVVAKRRNSPYRSAQRAWIKVKNREYWRFGQEQELARARPRQKLTI